MQDTAITPVSYHTQKSCSVPSIAPQVITLSQISFQKILFITSFYILCLAHWTHTSGCQTQGQFLLLIVSSLVVLRFSFLAYCSELYQLPNTPTVLQQQVTFISQEMFICPSCMRFYSNLSLKYMFCQFVRFYFIYIDQYFNFKTFLHI